MTTTKCKMCNTHKQDNEFYLKDRATGRKDTTCKACRIVHQRERTLGVTQSEYLIMYRDQSGRCGICMKRLYSKRYKAFAVDHNHDTNQIRGLLCHKCNLALGGFNDDSQLITRALEWLRRDSPIPLATVEGDTVSRDLESN